MGKSPSNRNHARNDQGGCREVKRLPLGAYSRLLGTLSLVWMSPRTYSSLRNGF